MDFSLSSDQLDLRSVVRDFVAKEAPTETLLAIESGDRSHEERIWRTIVDAGWLGLLVPTSHDGAGADFLDAAVVYEELGYGPVPGPFFSVVLAALLLDRAATDEQRDRWLPAIANGSTICVVATTERDWSWEPGAVRITATRDGARYVLDGTKSFVPDAHVADELLVTVRTGLGQDDVSLVMVRRDAPGVRIRRLGGFTGTECSVRFDNVEVPPDRQVGATDAGGAALRTAVLNAVPILCAYMLGGMRSLLDRSMAHSRTRVQFGRPIGQFQFVQDHIVRLVNHLDATRWTTYEALWKLDTAQEARVSSHVAKAVGSEAFRSACDLAHEVHAGMGVMREYGMTLHTRLSRSLYHQLGTPRQHRRRLGELLLASAEPHGR